MVMMTVDGQSRGQQKSCGSGYKTSSDHELRTLPNADLDSGSESTHSRRSIRSNGLRASRQGILRA